MQNKINSISTILCTIEELVKQQQKVTVKFNHFPRQKTRKSHNSKLTKSPPHLVPIKKPLIPKEKPYGNNLEWMLTKTTNKRNKSTTCNSKTRNSFPSLTTRAKKTTSPADGSYPRLFAKYTNIKQTVNTLHITFLLSSLFLHTITTSLSTTTLLNSTDLSSTSKIDPFSPPSTQVHIITHLLWKRQQNRF